MGRFRIADDYSWFEVVSDSDTMGHNVVTVHGCHEHLWQARRQIAELEDAEYV